MEVVNLLSSSSASKCPFNTVVTTNRNLRVNISLYFRFVDILPKKISRKSVKLCIKLKPFWILLLWEGSTFSLSPSPHTPRTHTLITVISFLTARVVRSCSQQKIPPIYYKCCILTAVQIVLRLRFPNGKVRGVLTCVAYGGFFWLSFPSISYVYIHIFMYVNGCMLSYFSYERGNGKVQEDSVVRNRYLIHVSLSRSLCSLVCCYS